MSKDTIYRQEAIDAVIDELKRIPTNAIRAKTRLEQLPSAQPMQIGWICPVCGRGLSPLTMVCPCQNGKGWEITCKT